MAQERKCKMNILHINEQLSYSLSNKIDFYKLDNYMIMMHLAALAKGNTKDRLPDMVRSLNTEEPLRMLVLNEADSSAVVFFENGKSETFDLKISFNDVMDAVLDIANGKVIRINKPNWEKNLKKLDLMRVKYTSNKYPVVRGLNGAYGKKLQQIQIGDQEALDFMSNTSGIIGIVLKLHLKDIEHFILWEEDMAFGVKLASGKYFCFSCSPDKYARLRNVLWKDLKRIVDEEQALK
jgi:hypothetical protein